MKKRLGVIGAGSAGILSLSYFLSHMSNEWDIVSIYDPTVPILGIGESTNPSFIRILELGTRFSVSEDTDALDSTLKFGTKFIGWREYDWLNPLITGGVAVHFNNFKLKEFAFSRFPALWPHKFKVIEGNVEHIDNTDVNITLTVNGNAEVFDYVIDCRGFPEDLNEDYHVSSCSLLNHCLVHSFDRFESIEYTEHIATENGWMFGIPLTQRKTYGYLFNDTITKLEDAKANMAQHLNVAVDELKLKEYNFKPYYTTKLVDKRLMKNGNRALFFEPISATSINQYYQTCEILFKHVTNQITAEQANQNFIFQSKVVEDIINFYYHGGTTYDSEFWQNASANAIKNLDGNLQFQDMINYNRRAEALGLPYNGRGYFFSPYNLVLVDEAFGYNYFKGNPTPFNIMDIEDEAGL